MLLSGYSFWQRVGFLAVLFLLAALIELGWKREKAIRWKEYLFLFFAAGCGAAFGILVDQVTSRISPEYFLYAKWLTPEDFDKQVIDLGGRAGFTAGAISGAALLVAKPRELCGFRPMILRLVRGLVWPLVSATVVAITLALISSWILPGRTVAAYSEVVEPERMARFASVMGTHWGLYVGGVGGTVIAVFRLRKAISKNPRQTRQKDV